MHIALTYSSKNALIAEYLRRYPQISVHEPLPADISAEGDSPETIQAVMNAFQELGHRVTPIESDDRAGLELELHHPDLVFNMAEGVCGDFRESYIPMLCERLGIPYTGSDPLTLSLCLNKARTKEILSYHGIPNAAFRTFYPNQVISAENFEYPAIIKPIAEGSSKGIYNDAIVSNHIDAELKIQKELNIYNQPILMEHFLEGDEFTVAIWGNDPHVEVLPIISIMYKDLPEGANPIYSYEAKWIWDTPEKPLDLFQCPAKISPQTSNEIIHLAKKTYAVLGVRDWCRIDLRLDKKGTVNVLEANPLPGILPKPEDNSCFPKAARTAGYSYTDMLAKILEIATNRMEFQHDQKIETFNRI